MLWLWSQGQGLPWGMWRVLVWLASNDGGGEEEEEEAAGKETVPGRLPARPARAASARSATTRKTRLQPSSRRWRR